MEMHIVNMIKLVEKKIDKTKYTPEYELEIKYMIGDANGYTSYDETFSIKCGDVLEKFCKILDKLKPLNGTWGIVFDGGLDRWFQEGQITQEDLDFWERYVALDYNDEDLNDEEAELLEELGELNYLIRGETEYSFLVYQSYKLTYYDENNVKHDTYFE